MQRRLMMGLGMATLLLLPVACGPSTSSTRAGANRESLVSAKCSACHLTPERASLDAERFDRVFLRHINGRRVNLSPEEQAEVRAYMVKSAK